MPNHALLNSVDHKDLKIITERSEEYGDNLWYAPIVPKEFQKVQAHYPILFHHDVNADEYVPVALFGFERGENLFLNENGWNAAYIPLSVQRMPFLIGFQEVAGNGELETQRVITVDMDSPRVNTEKGIDVFLEFGGNSEYLENISNILDVLDEGSRANKVFIDTLKKHNLIESVTLDIALGDKSKNQLLGFHTINEDALNALEDSEVLSLYRSGFLQAIYLVLSSFAQFQTLVDLKNGSAFLNK